MRTNKINGKQYVGQAVDFKKRENEWKSTKRCYAGAYINHAREKFGIENFETTVLRECATQDELNEWERYYILKLNTKVPNGYNLTDGGGGKSGYKTPEATRKKLSMSHKGIGLGEKRLEHSERMKGERNPFFHKTHSKEAIDKIKAANIGKISPNKGKTYEEQFGEEKAKELKQKCINNAYRVDQIDKVTGEVLHQWDCSKDAARELGLEYTNINKCAKGHYKTAFGYIWKRVA